MIKINENEKIMFMRDSVKNSDADKTNSNKVDEVFFITLSFLKIEISGFFLEV